MKNKIIYYKDELNDDFAVESFEEKDLTNYQYIHTSKFWNFKSFFLHKIIAIPIAFIYSKIVYNLKFKNKKVLNKHKNECYYIYGNHTQPIVDALAPSLVTHKKPYTLMSSKNLQIPFLGNLLPLLGGIPLPQTRENFRDFTKKIELVEEKNHPIVIYPEAHLWPYYTKIRRFKDNSFKYPVRANVPIYSFTTTYQKRKFFKKPKITIYIDGPFYPNKNLDEKDAKKELRDEVYNAMVKRTKFNNIEYLSYIQKYN